MTGATETAIEELVHAVGILTDDSIIRGLVAAPVLYTIRKDHCHGNHESFSRGSGRLGPHPSLSSHAVVPEAGRSGNTAEKAESDLFSDFRRGPRGRTGGRRATPASRP